MHAYSYQITTTTYSCHVKPWEKHNLYCHSTFLIRLPPIHNKTKYQQCRSFCSFPLRSLPFFLLLVLKLQLPRSLNPLSKFQLCFALDCFKQIKTFAPFFTKRESKGNDSVVSLPLPNGKERGKTPFAFVSQDRIFTYSLFLDHTHFTEPPKSVPCSTWVPLLTSLVSRPQPYQHRISEQCSSRVIPCTTSK